jgi:hypothetical protein
MLDSGLFLIINMAIIWVVIWAVRQDTLSEKDGSDKTDEVS